jgi:hypothetical protein
MLNKSILQKGVEFFFLVFTLVFSSFSLQAQNQLDENFKKNADKYYDMDYQVPRDYHGIEVEHCPLYFLDNSVQSSLDHSIKNDNLNFEVAFALVITKRDDSPRGKRIREVCGNPVLINLGSIANQIDSTLSKMKYLDTFQLKKVNASRGVIYDMKVDYKYRGIYAKCKKIELYKDNMGRVEILFFYNKGDDTLVDEEIEKTWGMLKFK